MLGVSDGGRKRQRIGYVHKGVILVIDHEFWIRSDGKWRYDMFREWGCDGEWVTGDRTGMPP